MDLQTFVADSIDAVLSGVAKARQKHSTRLPNDVSPEYRNITRDRIEMVKTEGGTGLKKQKTPAPFTEWELLRPIEFDVAVTVNNSDKVIVHGLEARNEAAANGGSETSTHIENSSVSRIKFSVLAKI